MIYQTDSSHSVKRRARWVGEKIKAGWGEKQRPAAAACGGDVAARASVPHHATGMLQAPRSATRFLFRVTLHCSYLTSYLWPQPRALSVGLYELTRLQQCLRADIQLFIAAGKGFAVVNSQAQTQKAGFGGA